MRRFLTLLSFAFLFLPILLAQRITDDQVIQYLKQANQQGRSHTEMAMELMRRGATKEQLERLKAQYKEAQSETNVQPDPVQQRQRVSPTNNSQPTSNTQSQRIKNQQVKTGLRELPETEFQDIQTFPEETLKIEEKKKFGMDFFATEYLSFEPNANIATPVNYRLGPGDEIIIDIWGASENTIQQVISPEGSIMVKNLGPVYLTGMTVKEANKHLQNEFSKIYSGISENASKITLTLGQNRSIQINIMGEVKVPGTYTLSSFSTVFHAIYRAGGINFIGGLRDIQVVRAGKTIARVDLYEYIMNGQTSLDIRLMEDDVILVNPYESLVNITGNVKRPMYYEMKQGETISTLLNFAGGFTGDAYFKNIRLIRLSNGREKQIFNVDEMDYSTFKLYDADSLVVGAVLDRYENMVEVSGAVYREGMYQLNGGVNTVKGLIKKAEGLRGDAYLERVQLQREREDLTLELIPINLVGILNGTLADIPLQKNDILYIPSIHDLNEERTLIIHGEVARPGTYLYADNMTVRDLIIQAGGLLEAATTARVDIARRIKDPKITTPGPLVGESFSFELNNENLSGKSNSFILSPFDEVYIRKSPIYHVQQNVTVSGEVIYSGNYALSKKNERISDLVFRAGGLTEDAYVRGARLIRKMTDEEVRRKKDALRMAQLAADSISIETLDIETTYPVGINLDNALNKPGSDSDLVLREGDELIIPEYSNTVKINGAVMHPNTVVFEKGKNLRYYIDQAGGYGNRAKKRKAYVVYMNGTMARLRSGNSKAIEPGCEIIVPSKEERRRMSTGEIIGIGTSIASLTTMVATLVNLLKK